MSPEALHRLELIVMEALGLISIFGLGFWFGFNQGIRQHEKAMRDALLTGMGIMKGGKRINPAKFFK